MGNIIWIFQTMTAHDNVPDPNRDQEDLNRSERPVVFQNEESENSEEDVEAPASNGYQIISQEENENVNQDYDNSNDEENISMEDQVAALVRAAHQDQNNLSDSTKVLIEESLEDQRKEASAEASNVWSKPNPRNESIELDDEKVETIKNLMTSIKLPHIPNWALDIGEDVLKSKLSKANVES